MMISTGGVLENFLGQCHVSLEARHKREFGHVGRKIAELQKQLEWLELQPLSHEINKELKGVRIKLNCWLEKENNIWRQRSRLNWFQSGDRNTSFFHAKASARLKKNFIEGILDENETWQEDDEKVEEVVVAYYNELFTTSQPTKFSELLQAIQPKVTPSMNQALTKNFKAVEVKLALKQMYPPKVPGSDGMPRSSNNFGR